MDSGPPFLCVNTNQWRLAGTRQPMGGYFAVSTLLFYFSCDLHQSKKVRTRRRGILGMNMNTEIMWIDFIILLRLSAFCRQAFFVVFLGFVSAVDHLLYLSLATQRWNRRCSAWILPKEFFQKFFCAFAKTHDADRFSGERGRKPYHPPLRTRRRVNTWKGAYNLGRINAEHAKLAAFYPRQEERNPATKYLGLQLKLFWWLEVNGGLSTQEKVDTLFDMITAKSELTGTDYESIANRELTLNTKGCFPNKV